MIRYTYYKETELPDTQPVIRLTADVYESLVRKLPVGLHVDNDTSPMQAGFQLGMQRVLKELRDGYVVSVG